MNITQEEIKALRELAKEYMEYASLPIQKEKMDLWKAFNDGKLTRPLITIGQLPWHELNYDGSLTQKVTSPMFKQLEHTLQKQIFQWRNFPVDMVLSPYITIPFCANNTGYGVDKIENTTATDEKNNVVSHAYQNQLETEDDLEKIKDMVITLDKETSKEWKECAEYIFDGIAPVYQAGGANVRLQIWDVLAELMNVENIYYALIDTPDFVHKIMEKMTHSALAGIDQMNELGLFEPSLNTCHCTYTYSKDLLNDFHIDRPQTSFNSWHSSMAQVFTSTSPDITKEFEIDYMSQISSKFAMFYYGCCERLDDRLDIVQKLPNLKKISCSPWSNRENFAERIDPKFIMSSKPSPAYIANKTVDYDVIQSDIRRTCDAAKSNNVRLEFLLKDISTVQYDYKRLTEWANIAMKTVQE